MSEARRRRRSALLAVVAVSVVALVNCSSPGSEGDGQANATEVTVHVGAVTRATLHRYVMAYGRVEPEPAGEGRLPATATIAAPVGGLLVEVDCAEGQRVAKGSTLFRLDSRTAGVALAQARQAAEYADNVLARQRELLDAGGTSEQALAEAEHQRDAARSELAAAETQLDLLSVKAPLDGTLVTVEARLGQAVDPSTLLAELVDLDRLVVAAAVPSREAAPLRPGQRVVLPSLESAASRVTFVGRDVDPATDTVVVRASLPPGTNLRPGQFLDLRVVAEERPDCLAVPEQSLVTRTGEGSWVMLVEGDRALRAPVSAGLREGGLVEVWGEGLKEGLTVVTDDAYSLPETTGVRILDR